MNSLNRARDIVQMKREAAMNVQIKQKIVFDQKMKEANTIRFEANRHRK